MNKLLHPFQAERVGSTVAENMQPYLADLISQISGIFFWIFFLGCIIIGIEFGKGIKEKKNKILFPIFWGIMVVGVLLTRYSAASLFNGSNAFSALVYFVGLILFVVYFGYVYFKYEIEVNTSLILIFVWALFMFISARATIRIYFLIAPFVVFAAAYALIKVFVYARTNKEETIKVISWFVFIVAALGLAFSLYTFVSVSSAQGKYIGPSANNQWQDAMNWTRANTPENAIFVHWWDYGFWTQTLGKRASITDGAHLNSFWDHLVGRYLLTTTKPETALSYMKANNVSYLLFDPTDIGKYPAYASIGSNNSDRITQISTFLLDEKQTQEGTNQTLFILVGGAPIFDDVIVNGKLLAKEKTGIGAFVLIVKDNQIVGVDAIFISNNQQIRTPIKNLYFNGQVLTFENASVDGALYLIPAVINGKINLFGAGMWLDNRSFNSLFVQLYLFNGQLLPQEYRSAFSLAYSAEDPVVNMAKAQQNFPGNIIYYQGLRAPLQIWKINYPASIIAREEFLSESGEYAGFDNLSFVR